MEGREEAPSGAQVEATDAVDPVRRVLLVEDDEDDALLVADLLEDWPEFELVVARTIGAAGAAIAERPADCVLLDLNLPDAVGLEALEMILEHDPLAAVVVLTGDADDQRGAPAVSAGAQDYLVKGRFDAPSLVRAVRYAVERRNAEHWRQELVLAQVYEAENARLQRGLLPAPILGSSRIRIATAYRPGARRQLLGGDFYDVVQTEDGVLHAVVGDVSGHGPDEAALGVRLRMAWRTLVLAGAPHGSLLGILDDVLMHERHHEGVFTTLAQVSIAADETSAQVSLAGHPAPMRLAGGRVTLADACAGGPALGLGLGATWPVADLELGDAWALLLYTDGLYEGQEGVTGQRLGVDGLVRLTQAQLAAEPVVTDAALERLVSEVEARHGGALSDDVAILALSARR